MKASPTILLPPEPGFPNIGTFAAMAALAGGHRSPAEMRLKTAKQFQLDLNLAQSLALAFHGGQRLEESPAHRQSLQPARESLLRKSSPDGNLPGARADSQESTTACITTARIGTRSSFAAQAPGRSILPEPSMIPWAAESPLIVGLTSIFWREAWKYRDRAYRYCCHDLGHAMMSVLLAARALGLPGGAIAHFSDVRLARALGLAESDEAPMAFLVFPAEQSRLGNCPPRLQETFAGIPNELSAEEVPYELLLGMHRCDDPARSCGPAAAASSANPATADGQPTVCPNLCRDPSRDAPLGVNCAAAALGA